MPNNLSGSGYVYLKNDTAQLHVREHLFLRKMLDYLFDITLETSSNFS